MAHASATEQQLALISQRTQRLGEELAVQVEDVKQLGTEKDQLANEVQRLRELLAAKEQQLSFLTQSQSNATDALRRSAVEYSRAQLLQKKYRNTLGDINGYCRTFVFFTSPQPAAAMESTFVLADECTVNMPKQNKSFVFDGVGATGTPSPFFGSGQQGTSQVQQIVADVLGGTTHCLFTFGPRRSGKTELLYGEAARRSASAAATSTSDTGVIGSFLSSLFQSMEELDVTHFNIRTSFAAIQAPDQFVDLLGDFSSRPLGNAQGADIRAVPVQKLADVMNLLHTGCQRYQHHHAKGGAASTNSSSSNAYQSGSHHSGGRCHTVFALAIETFNKRGHFRKATVSFVDVAGVSAAPSGPSEQWITKSVTALCNSISLLSAAAGSQADHQRHPSSATSQKPTGALVQAIGEGLGGNCKTTMLLCVDPLSSASASMAVDVREEGEGVSSAQTIDPAVERLVMTSLVYGLQLKGVRNAPTPYDIPAELQRLNLEAGGSGF